MVVDSPVLSPVGGPDESTLGECHLLKVSVCSSTPAAVTADTTDASDGVVAQAVTDVVMVVVVAKLSAGSRVHQTPPAEGRRGTPLGALGR